MTNAGDRLIVMSFLLNYTSYFDLVTGTCRSDVVRFPKVSQTHTYLALCKVLSHASP